MDVATRFLNYVRFDTQSDEESGKSPSTEKQWNLARYLQQELIDLGAKDVELSEFCYVYASIPATTEKDLPTLGLIAHMDTSSAVSGANVQPQRLRFTGEDLLLNEKTGLRMPAADYPELQNYLGEELILSDGSTLLGADDKAGIAEIITMAEYLLAHPEIEHGPIRLAFTPDEEIGQGPDHFDVAGFGADFAYTCDGDRLGAIEYENFNAASATLLIRGTSMHPGSARGRMKNAILMGMEFQHMLPVFENPACTDAYEGFYHLDSFSGQVEAATLKYIIRDHDWEKFQAKKQLMQDAVQFFRAKYGEASISLELQDSYYNMRQQVEPYPELIENALRAYQEEGLAPQIQPIRGGTDGARLSFMGLPCPNLGVGGGNFHSRYEFVSIPAMEKTVNVLIRLVQLFAEEKKQGEE